MTEDQMFRARSEASWRWRRAFREAEAAVMGLVLRGVLRPDADVFHDMQEAWTTTMRRSLGLDVPEVPSANAAPLAAAAVSRVVMVGVVSTQRVPAGEGDDAEEEAHYGVVVRFYDGYQQGETHGREWSSSDGLEVALAEYEHIVRVLGGVPRPREDVRREVSRMYGQSWQMVKGEP